MCRHNRGRCRWVEVHWRVVPLSLPHTVGELQKRVQRGSADEAAERDRRGQRSSGAGDEGASRGPKGGMAVQPLRLSRSRPLPPPFVSLPSPLSVVPAGGPAAAAAAVDAETRLISGPLAERI